MSVQIVMLSMVRLECLSYQHRIVVIQSHLAKTMLLKLVQMSFLGIQARYTRCIRVCFFGFCSSARNQLLLLPCASIIIVIKGRDIVADVLFFAAW